MLGKGFFQISKHLTRSTLPVAHFLTTRWIGSMHTHIYHKIQLNAVEILQDQQCDQQHNDSLLSRNAVVDAKLADLTSISDVVSLILKGNQLSHVEAITAKFYNPQL